MKNNRDAVYDYTSSSFDGLIAMASPEDSWVAKWQRIGICKCHALYIELVTSN